MSKQTFEDMIERDGRFFYTNKGTSMLPLIKENRDILVIEKTGGRLEKWDIPLYKRGKDYVLHRIVKVRQKDYVILGDNCMNKEYGITDKDIIGVLTAVIRDEKEIPVRSRKYKFYACLWYLLFPLRYGIKKMRIFFGKVRRKH